MRDVQKDQDTRNIYIDKVGISDVKYPINIETEFGIINTYGTLAIQIPLNANTRGIHMSRLIESLECKPLELNYSNLEKLLITIQDNSNIDKALISVEFDYFCIKKAPVSNLSSYFDYKCHVTMCSKGKETMCVLEVVIPIASLCPCSKEISEVGAHNQRGYIRISIVIDDDIISTIMKMIFIGEKSASCELFPILKRIDEKFVTEHAYRNAKFVEDICRDTVLQLSGVNNSWVDVEVVNFESIHNHNAVARIKNRNNVLVKGEIYDLF